MSAKCSLKRVLSVHPLADVEFGTFSTTNHIHNVIRVAVEMFGNIHGALVLGPRQMKGYVLNISSLSSLIPVLSLYIVCILLLHHFYQAAISI